MGEGATCEYHGTFPPTLTLPRQGGGNSFDFCKGLIFMLFQEDSFNVFVNLCH